MRRTVGGVMLLLLIGLPQPAYATGGDLDATFSEDGMVTGPAQGVAYAVAVQLDGKIVVAGGLPYGAKNPRFLLERFNADGTLDTTFSGDGILVTDFGRAGGEAAFDLAVQADGRIVAVGCAGAMREEPLSSGRHPRFAIARYNPDGSLDVTFGGDGRVTTDIANHPESRGWNQEFASAIAMQPDGKIVVAGQAGRRGAVLVRYRADGSLDESFGGGGAVISGGRYSGFASIALQGDGKIVAAGYSEGFAVARFDANGVADAAFGRDGWVTMFGGFGFGSSEANGVAIQPDGKIVAAGHWTTSCWPGGECDDFAGIARYMSDGSLDSSFGGDGTVVGDFGGWINAVAVQDDAKIVVAAVAKSRFTVVRYNADGSPDVGFGGDGKVVIFPRPSQARALVIQADGKVVAAGSLTDSFALARCLPA